jgi:hypothetical protein
MDEIPGGFWRAVAQDFIDDRRNKTFFGRSNLKLGACVGGLWPYLLELGGILGTKYGSKPDAFVSGFLGMSGAPSAANRFLSEAANRHFDRYAHSSMKFWEFVSADVAARLGHDCKDCSAFIMNRGAEKVPPNVALTTGWGFASQGAALGAFHSNIFRSIFERSHAPIPEEEWQQAYTAGLDIGPEQPRRTYAEADKSESENFLEYCRQARPDLYSVLKV